MTPSTQVEAGHVLSARHQRELRMAVDFLEHPHFAARLADYAGQPLNTFVEHLPGGLSRRLRGVVQRAIFRCLELAIGSLDQRTVVATKPWINKLVLGVTGGVGGFFGVMALPLELPLSTALMLRNISEIARAEGEDLSRLETRLACLEVFALGTPGKPGKMSADYYATRTMLAKLSADVAALVSKRGAVNASAPIVAKLVGEIVGRFGLMAADMSAASMVPVFGAVGGATLNVVFSNHFHRVARGHFTIRRLERIYGTDLIRHSYRQCADLPEFGRRAKRTS